MLKERGPEGTQEEQLLAACNKTTPEKPALNVEGGHGEEDWVSLKSTLPYVMNQVVIMRFRERTESLPEICWCPPGFLGSCKEASLETNFLL